MKTFSLFLRGLAMGLSDIIPGISGGTIALITGIYERFITACANVLTFKKELFRFLLASGSKTRLQRLWKSLDIQFLVTVLAGILLAVVIGSHVLSYALAFYELFVLAFLSGVIFTSAVYLLKKTKGFSWHVVLGVLIGAGISVFSPLVVSQPSFWYLVLGGALAISAMLLPGISGSFLLLILGLYEYVLSLVKNFLLLDLLPFLLGIILGVVSSIRLIHWTYTKYPLQTQRLMIGFIFGALLVPLQRMLQNYAGESLLLLLVFGLLGAGLVLLLEQS